jgi:hypothetical protein
MRRRNFLARELHEPRYGPRIVEEKRKHKLDEIHEREAEEELDDFLHKIGKVTKE